MFRHVFTTFYCCIRYFTGADGTKHTKAALTQEVEKTEESWRRTATEAAQPSNGKSGVKGLFEEILQEHGEDTWGEQVTGSNTDISDRANDPALRQPSPGPVGGGNHVWFPTLDATAAEGLCAPPTLQLRGGPGQETESRHAHLPEEEPAIALEIGSNATSTCNLNCNVLFHSVMAIQVYF